MTLVEINFINFVTNQLPRRPFIVSASVQAPRPASYWTDIFGAPDEENLSVVKVTEFIVGRNEKYKKVNSIKDCYAQAGTFYFDFEIQEITAHYRADHAWYTDNYKIGIIRGYCDNRAISLDGIQYDPIVLSAPRIARSQDFSNYKKLTFINGTITLNNQEGRLDEFIKNNIYGTGVAVRWLNDKPGVSDYFEQQKSVIETHTRKTNRGDERQTNAGGIRVVKLRRYLPADEIVDIAQLWIEDYDYTLSELTLSVQDLRKLENPTIPHVNFELSEYPDCEKTYLNKPVPLMYGQCRDTPATPVNGQATGNVTYRQALTLSHLGTVRILNDDDQWQLVNPINVDLERGEFTLSSAVARKSSGAPRKCRVRESIGIPAATAADVIVDLNERVTDARFTGSDYNTEEWNAEKSLLSPIGVYWTKKIPLYEAIRQIQQGANIGFRYEFTPTGKRTIRLNRFDRDPAKFIHIQDIKNSDTLPIKTDRDELAAVITVDYSRDYSDSEFLRVVNSDQAERVRDEYKQISERNFETLLQSEELAAERAAYEARRLGEIRGVAELDLFGSEYFSLWIFDIVEIDLTPAFIEADGSLTGREYWGRWRAQVLAVAPDEDNLTTKIRAVLTQRILRTEG